ncbi:MAG: metal ABC transporter permease [Clostridia bacterium]|nr:metal ABC transporter permease [Clostridia bacterium]
MLYLLESNQIITSFIGCILIAVLLGTIGTMVIHNKLAFFSDALGHCTFTGIALGNFIGIKNYQISTVLFAIVFAILIFYLIEKEKSSADTVISVFSSVGLSLGIFIITLNRNLKKFLIFLLVIFCR